MRKIVESADADTAVDSTTPTSMMFIGYRHGVSLYHDKSQGGMYGQYFVGAKQDGEKNYRFSQKKKAALAFCKNHADLAFIAIAGILTVIILTLAVQVSGWIALALVPAIYFSSFIAGMIANVPYLMLFNESIIRTGINHKASEAENIVPVRITFGRNFQMTFDGHDDAEMWSKTSMKSFAFRHQ